MTMKVSVAVLSILMVMTFISLASSAPSPNSSSNCCGFYGNKQIPRKLVTGYYETSGWCFRPAVMFLTKRGRHICANPSDAWVQNYVKELKEEVRGSGNLDLES